MNIDWKELVFMINIFFYYKERDSVFKYGGYSVLFIFIFEWLYYMFFFVGVEFY